MSAAMKFKNRYTKGNRAHGFKKEKKDMVNRKERLKNKTSAAQRLKNKFGKSRLGN
jgi:hypothetical protein